MHPQGWRDDRADHRLAGDFQQQLCGGSVPRHEASGLWVQFRQQFGVLRFRVYRVWV